MHPTDDHTMQREVWDAYTERDTQDAIGEPALDWTQYPGHGPGVEVLGDPSAVLELGCGVGRALAYLAQQGVKARGVDLSPDAVEVARGRWGHLGVDVVCADAVEYLTDDADTYDAVYSTFGAVWFTHPAKLLPLIRERLNPGGLLVFSHAPAIPGAYGPQGMQRGPLDGPQRYIRRYDYPPERWHGWLRLAGFERTDAVIVEPPTPGHVGTLLVRAVRSP